MSFLLPLSTPKRIFLKGQAPLRRLFSKSVAGPVKLSFAIFESNSESSASLEPPLVLLHGLFGSKRNFESIAKNLSQTGRQVITVDARNHGDSQHSPEMNYEVMSEDLEKLITKELHLKSVILLGHSMGGKTAMAVALKKPHLVDMLFVEDIAPTPSRSTQVTAFPRYIEAMRNVVFDSSVTTMTEARQMADSQLLATFPDKYLRDFILTNVSQRNGGFGWRVNLDALRSNLETIVEFPRFSGSYNGKAIFIGGRNSMQISSSDYPEIHRLFPKAVIRHIDGAGHWAHSDKPHEFISIVKQFLLDYERNKLI